MCSGDMQYQRGWHHHCSCIRHSCLEKLKWHAKKRMASSSVHALLVYIKATYSSAVTLVSAVIDLRTGGLRQPWENWELWNRTRFNWDSKKKEYLRRQTWSWTWQILSRPLHGCILHKPSTPPGSIDNWTTAMSSSQIENDFSSGENTLSSFFRTAGGDLISTENCKEGMRTEIWKKDWKGTKKLPLEAHIQRLWRSPFPFGCQHCKRDSAKFLDQQWYRPSAPAVVDCPSPQLGLL